MSQLKAEADLPPSKSHIFSTERMAGLAFELVWALRGTEHYLFPGWNRIKTVSPVHSL